MFLQLQDPSSPLFTSFKYFMFLSRKDFVQWERFLFIASWWIAGVQYKKSDALNSLFLTWLTNSTDDFRKSRSKFTG